MKNQNNVNHSEQEKDENGLNRRRFIIYSATAGTGLAALAAGAKHLNDFIRTPAAYGKEAPPASNDLSRVVTVRGSELYDESGNPKKQKVEWLLGAGISSLFGKENTAEAWRKLFKPEDVVGIKVNCIAGPELSTHPRVVAAIVSELQKIPIPSENIIIWDRTNRELQRAGYTINTDGKGVRCYGTDFVGYEDSGVSKDSFNGRLTKILTRKITALINVPILKNHGGAGVSLAMKNHYGSIHNPGNHHKAMCDPCIADLNSVDEIKFKTRLVVCDATRATCNGGPGYKPAYAWRPSTLILSTDPVALDTIGTRIIDDRRAEIGLARLADAGQYPRQLASAAERGLGNTKMNKIDLRSLNV